MASVFDGVPQLQGVDFGPALSSFVRINQQKAENARADQAASIQKQTFDQAQHDRIVKVAAAGALGASTPEQYAALIQHLKTDYNVPITPELADFKTGRSVLIGGDPEIAMTAKQMDLAAANQAQAQKNWQADYGLRKGQYDLAAAAPVAEAPNTTYVDKRTGKSFTTPPAPADHVVTNADSSQSVVRIMPDGTAQTVAQGQQGSNPYSGGGKYTDTQGNVANFADRMAAADAIITKPEITNINEGVGGKIGGVIENVAPAAAFNLVAGKNRQMSMQAKQDFINASLRRESGAAINQSEFDNGNRQFFPQPNDSAEVLAQKAANRQRQIQGFMREAGPSYKPPAGYETPGAAHPTGLTTAQEAGAAVGKPGQAVAAPAKGNKPLDQAATDGVAAAVAAGVPRAAIIQRLQEHGYDVSGLH